MRSRRPSSRRVDRRALVVLLALVSCGDRERETAAPAGFPAPDRVIAGPQGSVGQFVIECDFARYLADDPIVHPGEAEASHLHQFFGATEVSADSSYGDLLRGDTTCRQSADTASYWTPALVGADGATIEPLRAVAYYRAGPDVDPVSVQPYPPGFMAVAGDHAALEPQPTSVVAFGCGSGVARTAGPTDCGGVDLAMVVTFQDCWDGVNVRSPVVSEPDLHVSYSRAGACPGSHPVSIPQLQLVIDYPAVPDAELDALALSSGNIHTGHADFWNAWNQDKLDNEVARCINRDLVCGVNG